MRSVGGRWLVLTALALWGCDDGADPVDAGAADVGVERLDAMPDVMPDAAPDAMPDAAPDAMPDAIADAMPDAIPDAEPEEPPVRGPDPDPSRRMNHIQVRGTHNSYHIAREPTIPEWRYTHLPLPEQFGAQGVRQLELDVHWQADRQTFAVYHLPAVDDLSVCPQYADCLRQIDRWLRDNPDEGPIFVLVEPKDDVDADKVRDHLDVFDAEVRAHIAPWRLLTPDDVRGEHPDLRTAVTTDGWPSLHTARGRVMFVILDESETRDAYVTPDPTLAGRVYFPAEGRPDQPWSGVMLRDGAVEDAEGTRGFVGDGFIVRTRADDPETFGVALDSGAHMVSTDFPDVLRFEGDAAERCNPVAAPDGCGGR